MIEQDKIAKLPRWAQEHIEKIGRERDQAINALNRFLDGQTPSGFYVDDCVCTGEEQGPSRTNEQRTHRPTA